MADDPQTLTEKAAELANQLSTLSKDAASIAVEA